MLNNRKIAISGKSGCGNSSVSRLVAEKLGMKLINYTFRDMAKEKGVTFEQLCDLAEQNPSYDKELDRKQVELTRPGHCVLGSRLAIWLLDDADLKVYLEAPLVVRAKRIRKREGGNLQTILEATARRDQNDYNRYLRLYNIDTHDYGFADLIIDTTEMDQNEIADLIVETFIDA